ncbi:MAG: CRTAC1 family protein, partial [Bacteroidota bacterium]
MNAQVTFTQNTTALTPISGFAYNDCAVDMNGDFIDDVVRVTGSGITIDYSNGDGTFSQTSFPMNIQSPPSWSIAAGDIDDNGYNDLCFGGGSSTSFVKANSNGTMYTEDLQPDYIFSQRTTFADIDQDGHLDAFVCHDIDLSHPFRNDGLGDLSLDQSLIQTVNLPGNYAAIWVDYDNDQDIDLYITKCRGGAQPGDPARTNGLYQNDGMGGYTEMAAAANMDDNSQSWATVFEDFDNDGDMDAFIVNHDFVNRLLCNDGNGAFIDTIDGSGIDKNDLGAWQNAAADFDNDGNVDILSELNTSMLWGNGDLTFTAGTGISFDDGGIGDFNNDGFLDVVNGDRIYFNDKNSNHWIKITLEGTISNLNGIGARVEIFGSFGKQIRDVRSGQSFSPMSTLNAHFGIGQATAIDSIVVKWPSGIVDVVTSPSIDSTTHIVESMVIAVDQPEPTNNLVLAPNPATDRVRVQLDGPYFGEMTVRVYDIKGQVL